MAETKVGKIKFFVLDRGFGFIKTSDGPDFFFHVSDLQDQEYVPKAEDKVKFNVATGKRGLKASFVSHC